MASRCIKSISVASSGYADRYVVNSSVHRPRACRPRVPMPPAKWSRTAALGEDEFAAPNVTTDGPRTRSFWFPMSAALPSRVTWGKTGAYFPMAS